MDNNQDKICHATSNLFHGSSVQTKDVMSAKELQDATSEIDLCDGTIRFWLSPCIWAQLAWNESVKRTEHSSCVVSVRPVIGFLWSLSTRVVDVLVFRKESLIMLSPKDL